MFVPFKKIENKETFTDGISQFNQIVAFRTVVSTTLNVFLSHLVLHLSSLTMAKKKIVLWALYSLYSIVFER